MSPDHSVKHRIAIAVVYLSATIQALSLVSYPASSRLLESIHGFTHEQYGSIFIPQVIFAIIGAFAGSALSQRVGLKKVLWLTLLSNVVSQAVLGVSLVFNPVQALFAVYTGTAFMGLGFGLLGAPMNTYPHAFFPSKSDSAIMAIHAFFGLGLTIGPLALGAFFNQPNTWLGLPIANLSLALLLMATMAIGDFPLTNTAMTDKSAKKSTVKLTPLFWLFIAITIFYAFAEGSFSNWALVFLNEDKGLSLPMASNGLAAFWGAFTLGRLAVSAMLLKLPPGLFWILLPIMMITAFLIMPLGQGPVAGILLFTWAGMACSAFFPLTMSEASRSFQHHVSWISSMLIAAVMFGIGCGSFMLGYLHSHLSFSTLYRLAAIFPSVLLILAIIILRRMHQPILEHID